MVDNNIESKLKFESSESIKVYPSFTDMNLKEPILRGLHSYGLDKPSAVQQRAIVPIIQGRDVIVQSQAGTGKTAVFLISALSIVDVGLREPQVLILSNTRELAEQTKMVCAALGTYMNIQVHSCIGGQSIQDDKQVLDHGTHIVSGCPGRVFHMIQDRHLRCKNIKLLIIDECDEMLKEGF